MNPKPNPRLRSLRVVRLGLLAAALGAGVYGAWRLFTPNAAPAPAPRSGLDFAPNAEQRRKLEELRARLNQRSPRFASEDARQKSNAKLFMYMAATSDEPLVVEASLEAIQSAYASRSSRKEAPDADLDRALLRHLRSSRGFIASAAFRATRIPLMTEQPRPELVSALVDMARESEPAARRLAALEALDLIRPSGRSSEVLAAFETALSAPRAEIVSTALFALAQSGPAFEANPARKTATLGPRLLDLTGHADPGVRGRALALLAELEWIVEPAARDQKALKLLADAQAYVRAQAADAIARSGRISAIHRLIELCDDMAPAHYELAGFTVLDGSPGRLLHALPGRKRVAEAALYAIQSLSASAEGASGPLELTLGGRAQGEQNVRDNAELARTWYGKVRPELPLEP